MGDWDDSCGLWTHHHRGQTVTTFVRQCLDTCLPLITHLLRRIVVSHDNDQDDKGNVYLLKNQHLVITCLVSGLMNFILSFSKIYFLPHINVESSLKHSDWTFFVNIFYHVTLFENCRFSLPYLEVVLLSRYSFQMIKLFQVFFNSMSLTWAQNITVEWWGIPSGDV